MTRRPGSLSKIRSLARKLAQQEEAQEKQHARAKALARNGRGVPFEMLRVGSALNRINPKTGAPEFGVMDWISGLFKRANGSPATPPAQSPASIPLPSYTPMIPNVNGPNVTPPTYESLGFDPTGPGQLSASLRHPLTAIKGQLNKWGADSLAAEKFGNVMPRNNEADAYRHALWSRLMTESVGADKAKLFGDAHERSIPNDDSERLMDLYNNHVGRGLLGDTKPQGEPGTAIQDALRRGYLRTRPFEK